jgi:replicative DNA helicase
MERIEQTILRNLVFKEDYARKVIPFIQPTYFEQRTEKIIFQEIVHFIVKYGSSITIEALNIEVENRTDLTESEIKESREICNSLNDSPVDHQWLLDSTEKWCRDRAIYLALMESISIADGQDDKQNRDAIPSILSDALAVSFDNNIGHDYFENFKERYDFYHAKEDKTPFDLEYFNKITKGGLPNKTLNIALAGTGVGKSLFMCHVASSVLLQGRNVLYITMEMAEEKIAERIDANLLNVPIQDLTDLPKSTFENKVAKLAAKTHGKLIIKEYPTASAHSGHFKALLNELALKKSFKPDIIFIDYLNICASSYVLPPAISRVALSIHILILSQLQKSLEGWLLKQMSLSFLPRRPLVLVLLALTLTLLTLLNPLASLLLLILCLPLFLQMSLRGLDKLW